MTTIQTIPTNYAVGDYCHMLERGEIQINRDYQRSDKIWPLSAKSFFVESVLLGFPVPKLCLHQNIDLKTRRSIKHVVDGQQRSMALLEYFSDSFRLSSNLESTEFAGKKYSSLSPEHRKRFLEYSLSVDLFVSATNADIREVFRRMNSYNVPLNPEEQRHAVYQGAFKWFIHHLSHRLEETFLKFGTFTNKKLIRRADSKLLTDVCYAYYNGLQTTKAPQLDRIYKQYDGEFKDADSLDKRITAAMTMIDRWVELYNTPILKKDFVLYALILSVMHLSQPIKTLSGSYSVVRKVDLRTNEKDRVANLAILSEALSNPDEADEDYEQFIDVCSARTNVAEQRELRFVWICDALALNM